MSAYYNEHDGHAARWLRNLGGAGLIPEGAVDTRDIQEVGADDVRNFRECHFFAGIGGWPAALALAGWPANEPVWTGSCPCQPFSSAGKRKGTADARHLWPFFRDLIGECRPSTVFGEQVSSSDGRDWLAGVRADLEAMGYAVGAADLCAAGAGEEAEGRVRRGDQIVYERVALGAPHVRQRLFWVAHAPDRPQCGARQRGSCVRRVELSSGGHGSTRGLEHPEGDGRFQGRPEPGGRGVACGRGPFGLGDPRQPRLAGRPGWRGDDGAERPAAERDGRDARGFWSDFDLIPCRDGKARRTQPGLFPLVDGFPFLLADGRTRQGTSRAAILKGGGNAIVPQVAAVFVRAFMSAAGITDEPSPLITESPPCSGPSSSSS